MGHLGFLLTMTVLALGYPDSDTVLIGFDVSRPETLHSVVQKWQGETQEFCPSAKVVLLGCKRDMQAGLATPRELLHMSQALLAGQVGAMSCVG